MESTRDSRIAPIELGQVSDPGIWPSSDMIHHWTQSIEPHRSRPHREAFVVVGDELLAGAGPFGLSRHRQQWSFPALAASRLGWPFRLPELPSAGVGTPVGRVPGGPNRGISLSAPTIDPAADSSPATLVALPGIGFHEAVHLRVTQPLLGNDSNQDLFNLALGLPALLDGRRALTPVEMAASLQPETTLIGLGYHESCRAAAALDPTLLPPLSLVRESLEQTCATLGPCRRILTTVPDPLLSTFFLHRDIVARWWRVEPDELGRLLDWQPDHLLPACALGSVGAYLDRNGPTPRSSPPTIAFLTPALTTQLRKGLAAVNDTIRQIADHDGALLLDLESLFQRLTDHGLSVEGRTIHTGPGGGFFSWTSFLPGPVGHGIIADLLVELLQTELVMARVSSNRPPSDRPQRTLAWENLFEADEGLSLHMEAPGSANETMSRPITSSVQLTEPTSEPLLGPNPTDLSDLLQDREHLFELGPDNGCLDRVVKAEDPDLIFGGPAIGRSAVQGKLRLRLLPEAETQLDPDSRPWVSFELTLDPDLAVEATPLSAPHIWRCDLPHSRLRGAWTGLLHRQSGRVRGLKLQFEQDCPFRSRLSTLCPEPPEDRLDTRLEISRSPGGALQLGLRVIWSSSWSGQKSGLGAKLPWLPEASTLSPEAPPTVCIGCRRVTLSQQLHLRASARAASSAELEPTGSFPMEVQSTAEDRNMTPWPLPSRSFLELTSFCHDSRLSAFASVDAPPARAEVEWAHPLLGRWVLQSGEPSGDRLPILIHPLPFEACLGPLGWLGFESEVRFGKQIYPQPTVRLSPPSRSLNMCSLERLSSASVGPFDLTLQDDRRLLTDLHELQDLHELSGPIASVYRGIARFETRSGGDLYFFLHPSFNPVESSLETTEEPRRHPSLGLKPSTLFPAPHGTSGYPIRTESRLDFDLRLTASRGLQSPSGTLSGEERLLSSTRRLFSYRYILSTRASDPATFELTDHTLGGTFVLKHLAHIVFGSSPSSRARRTPDTVTFSGFGTWSLDPEGGPTHRISAHLCRSRHSPFIAVAIDEGTTSSICTAFCD